VNRLKIQRLESRRKARDIYKIVGCLMPYRLCALTSAQLKLSSVRFMQHPTCETVVYQFAFSGSLIIPAVVNKDALFAVL
jgi:hypothetical protein